MEEQVVANQEVVEQSQAPQLSEREQIEQEALARFKQSQLSQEEQSQGMPEGYNEDGTEKEELIAGKFKSQEELLKAYQELEKKQSKPEVENKVNDQEQQPTNTSPVDVAKYGKEVVDNGSLSEASYGELEAMGFSRQDVDNYIATRQQMGNAFNESVFAKTGGQEGYQELVTWAKDNLSSQMINEYNTALANLDTKRATEIIDFMQFRRGESAPKQPRRLEGNDTTIGGIQPFADKNEWQRAQSNRLYGKDAKFTNMVDKRYLASRRSGIL